MTGPGKQSLLSVLTYCAPVRQYLIVIDIKQQNFIICSTLTMALSLSTEQSFSYDVASITSYPGKLFTYTPLINCSDRYCFPYKQ